MKVDTKEVNPAFQSIIQNPGQKVFLDANFFIPSDRSEVAKVRAYLFTFLTIWIADIWLGKAALSNKLGEIKCNRNHSITRNNIILQVQ